MRSATLLFIAAALASASCTTVQSNAAGRTFVSDRISVATRGNGPDIILVPGLVAHRDVWRPAAEQLDRRYRLHVVQLNGFGGLPAGANADGPLLAPIVEEIARYIRIVARIRSAMGDDSNHYIQLDRPARFVAEVERFMRP